MVPSESSETVHILNMVALGNPYMQLLSKYCPLAATNLTAFVQLYLNLHCVLEVTALELVHVCRGKNRMVQDWEITAGGEALKHHAWQGAAAHTHIMCQKIAMQEHPVFGCLLVRMLQTNCLTWMCKYLLVPVLVDS